MNKEQKIAEALHWVKKRYEDEWTYEPGTGEVVEEILQKFEEIGVTEE